MHTVTDRAAPALTSYVDESPAERWFDAWPTLFRSPADQPPPHSCRSVGT